MDTYSSNQSMTSCVTKMAISQRARSAAPCTVTSQDIDPRCRRKSLHTRLCAAHGRPFQCLSSLQQQTDLLCCFFHGCNQAFLQRKASIPLCRCKILGCSSPFDTWHLQTNPLQLPYTITVYGLTLYICEHFTGEYFHTTVPSNRECKNAKNTKITNPRNINPRRN